MIVVVVVVVVVVAHKTDRQTDIERERERERERADTCKGMLTRELLKIISNIILYSVASTHSIVRGGCVSRDL